MILGGVIAAWRPPGPYMRSAILHFAGGVVLAVVAVELLPHVMQIDDPPYVVAGFSMGIGLMLLIKRVTHHLEEKKESSNAISMGLIFGVGIDIFIDGLLLGIGFAAGAKEGLLLTGALTAEVLSLGLATATSLGQSGVSRLKSVGMVAGLALLFAAGAGGGATVLSGLTGRPLETVLSFGVAALLYLVTEELLIEAHEVEETPWLTATFFVGFLVFLVLGMM